MDIEKIDLLFDKLSLAVEKSQINVVKHVNSELVKRNWLIGQYIVEFEQKGEKRAVERCKQFYVEFDEKASTVWTKLSWSHIKVLLGVSNEARNFYCIGCENQNWSVRQLERQISTQLFERVALSKSKEEILELSKKGQEIIKPLDIIKDSIYLDFLNLKEDYSYTENDIEEGIISNLQQFLLELGKGFTFISRQLSTQRTDNTN